MSLNKETVDSKTFFHARESVAAKVFTLDIFRRDWCAAGPAGRGACWRLLAENARRRSAKGALPRHAFSAKSW